jgi:hypothetical protein
VFDVVYNKAERNGMDLRITDPRDPKMVPAKCSERM